MDQEQREPSAPEAPRFLPVELSEAALAGPKAVDPVDQRIEIALPGGVAVRVGRGFDAELTMKDDAFAGDLFVFRSRRADRIKVLMYDGTGLCLYQKRLEQGRFRWPSMTGGTVRLSAAQMAALLEGLEWSKLQPHAVPRPQVAC